MSSQNPHDLDCAEVIEAVYVYLDREMQGPALDRIQQHLDDCGPCLREYGIEREVKILVARCCTEIAPQGLRDQVVARLNAVRVELEISMQQSSTSATPSLEPDERP
jgi:mycothiol system anti-sigma-R factor